MRTAGPRELSNEPSIRTTLQMRSLVPRVISMITRHDDCCSLGPIRQYIALTPWPLEGSFLGKDYHPGLLAIPVFISFEGLYQPNTSQVICCQIFVATLKSGRWLHTWQVGDRTSRQENGDKGFGDAPTAGEDRPHCPHFCGSYHL